MIAPQWIRLDNAAIIYPSCRTRRYAAQFRMSVTLDHEISLRLLNVALNNIIGRFPGFTYTLGNGFFWWYLHRLDNMPVASRGNTMNIFSLKDNGGYMFKAGCNGCKITLDIFHALTDGTGAMTFLMSLTAEYLRLKEGITPEYGGWILNPAEEALPEEMEDSFDSFSGLKGSLDKERKAWHIPGTKEPSYVLHNTRFSISTGSLAAKSREYNCTITELLTSLMLAALQDTRTLSGTRKQNGNLKIEVPVNLRPMFNRKTLRNFSSYVHLGVDAAKGDWSLDEIIKMVRSQKADYVKKGPITTRVAANVALEDNLAIRCIPRMIKKPIINLVNTLKGDRYCSYTLSNLGEVKLPESVAAHVRDVDFLLGRARGRSGACACASFGGRLNMNFTRGIAESVFERRFLYWLDRIGIDCSLQFTDVAERIPAHVQPLRIPEHRVRIGWSGTPFVI